MASTTSGIRTSHLNQQVLFLLLAFTVLALEACDRGGAVPPDDTITTDSAGVVIVESFRPGWEIEEIDAATRVTLSLGEGPNGYPLGNVTQALRLGDGRIVFVDFQSSEVKSFRQGEGVRVLAGRGEGPGEFLFPGNLQRLAGDSVQVYDRRQGRVSVFSPEGEFAYGISVQKAGRRPPTSMMRAGPQLLIGLSGITEGRRVLAKSDVADLGQTPVAVRTFDLTGREQDTVAILPGYQDIRLGPSSMSPAYGVSTPFAVTSSGMLVFGSGAEPEHFVARPDGTIMRIHRIGVSRKPVSQDSLARVLSQDPAISSRLGGNLMDLPFLQSEFLPEQEPVYKSIRSFGDEEVWLGSADPFMLPSSVWHVVSRAGEWVGTVRLPPGAELMDVSGGFMILRRSDSMGVQSLQVLDVTDMM